MQCFQLFRFEVIGEPLRQLVVAVKIVADSFQLFRFEVIGERYKANKSGYGEGVIVSNYSDLK